MTYITANFDDRLCCFKQESSDDSTSVASAAPTETYQSPYDTPKSLSLLDLTLSNQVTDHDIQEHAAHTQPELGMY